MAHSFHLRLSFDQWLCILLCLNSNCVQLAELPGPSRQKPSRILPASRLTCIPSSSCSLELEPMTKTYSVIQETLQFSQGSQNGLHPSPCFQAAWPISKVHHLFLDLSSDSCLLVFLSAACHSLVGTSSVLRHRPPLISTLTLNPNSCTISRNRVSSTWKHHQLSKPTAIILQSGQVTRDD